MVSIEETIFTRKRWVLKKMLAFGFQQVGDDYVLERRFLNGDFEAILTVTEKGMVTGRVIDAISHEEYYQLRQKNATGAYVNTVRAAGEDETVVLEHPMLKRDARDFFLNAVREVTDRPVECVVLKTDPEEVKEIADHQPAFIRLHDSEIGVMDIPGEDEGFCSVTIVTNVLK